MNSNPKCNCAGCETVPRGNLSALGTYSGGGDCGFCSPGFQLTYYGDGKWLNEVCPGGVNLELECIDGTMVVNQPPGVSIISTTYEPFEMVVTFEPSVCPGTTAVITITP